MLNFWTRPFVRAAVVALVVTFSSVAPAAAQAPQDQALIVNLQHTLVVRKAFLNDKHLAPLNLGVKVENRVAYLWGAVPSAEVLARAIDTTRGLPDILDVHSSLYVDDSAWPEAKYLPDPPAAPAMPVQPVTPPLVQPAAGDPVRPAAKTTSTQAPEAPKTPAPTPGLWQPATTEKNVSLKTPIEVPKPSEDQGLFVLPPIALPPGASDIGNAPLLPVAGTLQQRVLQLKHSDMRYQHVHAVVDGARVYLSGTVAQLADVQHLAKAIAQLPGVESVVIGYVQIRSGK
jgi:hypothetical protein